MSTSRKIKANNTKNIIPIDVTSDSFRHSKLFRGQKKEYLQNLSSPNSNLASSMKKPKHRACVASTVIASTQAMGLLLKKKLYAESFPIA
mmetsp:Transcript_3949/g.6074  ORF Transcript_3949/g.6074 Transcript_3949/m.6074 type:complete len:90 (-) Transcript_3949:532-801(-)